MFEQNRAWLETLAQQAAGRRIAVAGIQPDAAPSSDAAGTGGQTPIEPQDDRKSALREQALADAAVQAVLEIFPAEIRDVEEM